MPITARYIPGIQLAVGNMVTEDVLNALANPTIDLEGTFSTNAISDNSITEPKFVDGVVSTRVLQNGSVTSDKLANWAVTEPAIGNGAVSNRTLAPQSVTIDKLAPALAANFGSDGTLQAYDPTTQLLAARLYV